MARADAGEKQKRSVFAARAGGAEQVALSEVDAEFEELDELLLLLDLFDDQLDPGAREPALHAVELDRGVGIVKLVDQRAGVHLDEGDVPLDELLDVDVERLDADGRRGRGRLQRPPAVARCALAAEGGPDGRCAGMRERARTVIIAVIVIVGVAVQLAWAALLSSPLVYLLLLMADYFGNA